MTWMLVFYFALRGQYISEDFKSKEACEAAKVYYVEIYLPSYVAAGYTTADAYEQLASRMRCISKG